MSALGQKPTYALQQAMSALHPIATLIAFFCMSVLGQKRTSYDTLRGACSRAVKELWVALPVREHQTGLLGPLSARLGVLR
jgi:hypothetical protein